MRDLKRGEIWLVNLDPTIGYEIKKSRPALIIQNDVGNKYSPITIIAPISSQNIDKTHPVEVLIQKKYSALDKDSKVLLNQIRAVDRRRLIKKLGKVSLDIMGNVDEAIKISLGLISIE